MFTNSQFSISIAAICFVVGILGVTQFRTQNILAKAIQNQSPANQAQMISGLIESNTTLNRQIQDLRLQISRYQEAPGKIEVDTLVADLNRLKIINGFVEVAGPGIEVKVNGEIKTEEFQDLINELRNAGAETMAFNEQRLVGPSVVTRDSGGILVNGQRVRPPYTLQAIGDRETLERAAERKGGLLSLLRYNYPHMPITSQKIYRLVLPIYEGGYVFSYARPLE